MSVKLNGHPVGFCIIFLSCLPCFVIRISSKIITRIELIVFLELIPCLDADYKTAISFFTVKAASSSAPLSDSCKSSADSVFGVSEVLIIVSFILSSNSDDTTPVGSNPVSS